MNHNITPDILNQFTPEATNAIDTTKIIIANISGKYVPIDARDNGPVTLANVGTNKVTINQEERQMQPVRRTFEPIPLKRSTGPLIIHEKRWYFRLVQGKKGDFKRARALMDDFNMNEIAHHMIVCFTPDTIPGRRTPFRNKEGKPIRIYAFFDSYLEFFDYMQKIQPADRAFYEIIFGELPQKPHFDIDIDASNFNGLYPGEDIETASEILREAIITACIEVLAKNMVMLDLEKDVLLYSSHGPDKRSYHLILNNKCHDGNKEAKAFYDAVMTKIRTITGNKYLEFVDKSVYSPRQQFRLVGCQKPGSERPKVFYEKFWYQGKLYTHIYNEDVTDIIMKKLTIIYESIISFTSGCAFLPSLIPPKLLNQNNLGDFPDLDGPIAEHCMIMLREKMAFCPFSIKEIRGHLILLRREAPSQCPICRKQEPHENEHPYMFIIGGKVYWDCRRSTDDTKKFFVGYLAMTIDEMQAGDTLPGIFNEDVTDEEDVDGVFMFGDYDIGAPTLPRKPITNAVSPLQQTVKQSPMQDPRGLLTNTISPRNDNQELVTMNVPQSLNIEGNPTIYIPSPERRRQNIGTDMMKLTKAWAQKKYIRQEPEDLTGVRTLGSVTNQMAWTSGMSGK